MQLIGRQEVKTIWTVTISCSYPNRQVESLNVYSVQIQTMLM